MSYQPTLPESRAARLPGAALLGAPRYDQCQHFGGVRRWSKAIAPSHLLMSSANNLFFS